MLGTRNRWRTLVLVLLITAGSQVALGQIGWTDTDLPYLNPADLAEAERRAWDTWLERFNAALDAINDENPYRTGEYECNRFADSTARELQLRGFTVKRAMSTSFQAWDGTTGQHHWVFVIIGVRNEADEETEVWVPVECTPPEGERQKDEGRAARWPRIPFEGDGGGVGREALGDRFDPRYFRGVCIRDAPNTRSSAQGP